MYPSFISFLKSFSKLYSAAPLILFAAGFDKIQNFYSILFQYIKKIPFLQFFIDIRKKKSRHAGSSPFLIFYFLALM
ncbi:hypothetical protein AS034_04825 [[Bacillus] enclensis]|nr:hypothetical protein AS034_04825 [[Bacillus] enclensis]